MEPRFAPFRYLALCVCIVPYILKAQAPVLRPNSVVNNASYGNLVAPGSIAAVFGSNLTDGSSCLPPGCGPAFGSDGRLATVMAGAGVTVNGIAAPLFYATPGQLGIQIPVELTGASAAVQVTVNGVSSGPVSVPVASTAPGIFTFTADGQGAASATHLDGSLVNAQHPAAPGEVVTLYATGLGPVSPPVSTGALPGGLSGSVAQVGVVVDGIPVTPDFAGLSGCCVGLNQVNFRVPATVHTGSVSLSLAAGAGSNQTLLAIASTDVLQHHRSATRDGLYTDPLLTLQAAAQIHRDSSFKATLPGPTYAQPLLISNGPGGSAALIVATEQNQVLALDATTGAQIWTRSLGAPAPRAQLPCGNIDPLGVTGTPVIDAGARAIYVAAMTTPDGGTTKRQRIFALSLDDGSVLAGWPVEVNGINYHGISFNSTVQDQRGALLLNAGTLYVPYAGHNGDCGNYHGWVIAAPVANPAGATAWATDAAGGGSWGPGGVASDGQFVFAATGNTFGATSWAGGEAVVRLSAGAAFSGSSRDYFTPSNWKDLDNSDTDVGGSGPLLIDVPGASPSQLAVALGKNGVAYLLDRNSLGGIGKGNGTTGEGVQSRQVANGVIINAAAAYATAQGSYVVFNTAGSGVGCPGSSGNIVALRIGASAPPAISVAWCASVPGRGSPIVTTVDGHSQAIVWVAGAEGSNRLYALDGQTGQVVFGGGGTNEQMSQVRRFQTAIEGNGRIFVAADNELFAFTVR